MDTPSPGPASLPPPHAGEGDAPAAPQPGWRLVRRPHGHVDFVEAAGVVHADVDVLRAFPVTAPQGPVAIVAADGTELAWLESLDDVAEPLRGGILAELSTREFLPVIERIEAISADDPPEWKVSTDRGERRFRVTGPEDIDRVADGSAFVVDTSGVRYRIVSIAALDPQSRRLLDDTME